MTDHKHEPQHPDSPTWCIHCGTFDRYFAYMECSEARSGYFDTRKSDNAKSLIHSLFGDEEARKWLAPRKLEHL